MQIQTRVHETRTPQDYVWPLKPQTSAPISNCTNYISCILSFSPPSHSKALVIPLTIFSCRKFCTLQEENAYFQVPLPFISKCIPVLRLEWQTIQEEERVGESQILRNKKERKRQIFTDEGLAVCSTRRPLYYSMALTWKDVGLRGQQLWGRPGEKDPRHGTLSLLCPLHGPKAQSLNLKGTCKNLLVITHDYGYIYKWFTLKLLGSFQNPTGDRREISDGELVFLSAYHSDAQLNVIFASQGDI